jgi:hypothetical protein
VAIIDADLFGQPPLLENATDHRLDLGGGGSLPLLLGGESSVAKMAPEISSVTVSQLASRPSASLAFSTASTCQTSCTRVAVTTTWWGRLCRRGRSTPAARKLYWIVLIEGI